MAANPNPFDQFDAPAAAPNANPFNQFDAPKPAAAPAAAPASPQDLGMTALWNKPANVGWGDYMLAHLAKPFQGADQAAQDYSRTAVDAATFGLGDRFQSYLTGNSLADERGKTAAAAQRLGAMAPIVSGAMYAMGPGELGAASKIGEAIAPATGKWLGGVLGSAAEGTAAGAAGAAGHDEGIGQGALVGGALGAAGGLTGGVVGRGGALAPAASEDALRAQAKTAYAPLSQILYDGRGEVHPALDDAENDIANIDLTGQQRDLAKSTMAIVNNLRNKPQISALDIQSAQKQLGKIGGSIRSSDQDTWMAPKFNDALQSVLENGLPQTGVPATLPPGVSPSNYAAWVKNQGDMYHGRAEDVKRLNDWINDAQVNRGPDVASQAGSYLRSDAGKQYAPPGSPQYQALNELAGTSGGQDVSAAPSLWDIRHFAHPLVGAGMGAAFGAAQGHGDPTTIGEEAATGLALGYGLHKGVPLVYGKFIEGPAQQRALEAARSALSTGNYQGPVMPTTPLRDALRTVIFGQGARGAY